MKNEIEYYQQHLVDELKFVIQMQFYAFASNEVLPSAVFELAMQNLASLKFQKYYMSILQNESHYYSSEAFFKEFKQNYSLQFVDDAYLTRLEENKEEILKGIRSGAEGRTDIYFKYFKSARLKRGDKFIDSEQGSFFTKLVHTFLPDEYCALDGPIKTFFDLKKETFFSSFLALSQAYREYATENPDILKTLRFKLQEADVNNEVHLEKCSDLKILDLIFWVMANKSEKLEKLEEDEQEIEDYSHVPEEVLTFVENIFYDLKKNKLSTKKEKWVNRAISEIEKSPILPKDTLCISFSHGNLSFQLVYSDHYIWLSGDGSADTGSGWESETAFDFRYEAGGYTDTTGNWDEAAYIFSDALPQTEDLSISDEE
jgi:hypothetical protein